MRLLYIILLLSLFASLDAESNIDAQIQKIRNAPPAQRVKMMNALKVQLSQMNAAQRNEAISHLRSRAVSSSSASNDEMHNNNSEMPKDSYQSDDMQEMHGVEMMNQKQGEDQYIDEHGGTDNYTNYMQDDSSMNSDTEPNIINDTPVEYETQP